MKLEIILFISLMNGINAMESHHTLIQKINTVQTQQEAQDCIFQALESGVKNPQLIFIASASTTARTEWLSFKNIAQREAHSLLHDHKLLAQWSTAPLDNNEKKDLCTKLLIAQELYKLSKEECSESLQECALPLVGLGCALVASSATLLKASYDNPSWVVDYADSPIIKLIALSLESKKTISLILKHIDSQKKRYHIQQTQINITTALKKLELSKK